MPPAEVLYAENLALKSERDALQGEVLDLKRQLEWLRRQVFGPGQGERKWGQQRSFMRG